MKLRDTYLEEAQGDPEKAAALLAARLMEGEPEVFKAGYTRDNAIIAASEVFDIDRARIAEILP